MTSFTIYSYAFKGLYEFDPVSGEEELAHVNVNESVAQKQQLFESFFDNADSYARFVRKRRSYGCQLLWRAHNIIALRIENRRTIKRDINFQTDEIETFPWVVVIIDNRKDIQHIAILNRPKAFSNPNTVADIMQETFNIYLRQFRLTISINPQYRAHDFWNLLEQYRPWGIKRIQFNFAFPNKDWATEMMGELAELSKNANGDAQLGFEARKDETLTFQPNVPKNRELVNAATGTGQDILIKPINHKTIHTQKELCPVERTMKDRTFKALEENKYTQEVHRQVETFCNACLPYYDVQETTTE